LLLQVTEIDAVSPSINVPSLGFIDNQSGADSNVIFKLFDSSSTP